MTQRNSRDAGSTMAVRVIAQPDDIGPGFRRWASELLAQSLRRFRSRIRSVVVRVFDINGPRGGMDKQVAIEVISNDGTVERAVGRATSYGAALTMGARRAKRLVLCSPNLGARRPR